MYLYVCRLSLVGVQGDYKPWKINGFREYYVQIWIQLKLFKFFLQLSSSPLYPYFPAQDRECTSSSQMLFYKSYITNSNEWYVLIQTFEWLRQLSCYLDIRQYMVIYRPADSVNSFCYSVSIITNKSVKSQLTLRGLIPSCHYIRLGVCRVRSTKGTPEYKWVSTASNQSFD